MSDVWVMRFTAVLTVFTLFQIALWVRSNRTAEGALSISKEAHGIAVQSLDQTTRSVNAFIEAERGRLSFFRAGLSHTTYNYWFKNIGSGPLIVNHFGTTPIVYARTEDGPEPQDETEGNVSDHPLMSGEYFATARMDDISQSNHSDFFNRITDVQQMAILRGTHNLFVQFEFGYSTMGSFYRLRECQILYVKDGSIRVLPVPGEQYRFDKRVDDQLPPSMRDIGLSDPDSGKLRTVSTPGKK